MTWFHFWVLPLNVCSSTAGIYFGSDHDKIPDMWKVLDFVWKQKRTLALDAERKVRG